MFFPLYFDPTYILLIPAVLLALYAQTKVTSTYNKYMRVRSRSGITGADAARERSGKIGFTMSALNTRGICPTTMTPGPNPAAFSPGIQFLLPCRTGYCSP